jgi:hypothetical protein
VTLTIAHDTVRSSRSPHTARLFPGTARRYEVSWLPGRPLNRNDAITAMTIADTAHLSEPRMRQHIQSWAAELGMSATHALALVDSPPSWAAADLTAAPADPEAAG